MSIFNKIILSEVKKSSYEKYIEISFKCSVDKVEKSIKFMLISLDESLSSSILTALDDANWNDNIYFCITDAFTAMHNSHKFRPASDRGGHWNIQFNIKLYHDYWLSNSIWIGLKEISDTWTGRGLVHTDTFNFQMKVLTSLYFRD